MPHPTQLSLTPHILAQLCGAVCEREVGGGHHECGGDPLEDLRAEQSHPAFRPAQMEAHRSHGGWHRPQVS